MHHGGDRARALPLLEEGVALARPTNDGWLLGHCLYTLGNVLVPQGRMDEARAAMREGLAALRAHGDLHGVAEALRALGNLLNAQNDPDEARGCIEESVALSRELGDVGAAGRANLILGYMAYDAGENGRARAHFDDALRLCQQVGDRFGAAHALHNRAHAFLAEGGPDAAAAAHEDFTQSSRLFQALGYDSDLFLSLEGFAQLAAARQLWGRAVTLLVASAALREAAGLPAGPINQARYEQRLSEPGRSRRGALRRRPGAGRALDLESAIAFAQDTGAGAAGRLIPFAGAPPQLFSVHDPVHAAVHGVYTPAV
jgi:tetratricopeptide (TPR) repeat protein